ncbi:MAG: SusC/RagA family TonB-linked outer membrane protein [Sphingobacterium sp.]
MKKKKPIRNRWLRMGQYSLSWRHTPLTALLLFQLAHSGEAFAEIPPAEHLLNTSYSADQDQIITGQVKDVNGNPLQGVTVSVMDNERVGTSTDANGRFVLEVEGNATILLRLVGFLSQEVPVQPGQKDIELVLEEDLEGIDEVVVVGFGTQKKESNVGSQATIKREELKVPVANLSTAIAGRLAGVVATQRSGGPGGGGADLFVRGVSTFASSPQSPLLIVDGVPDRDINNIDPEDIENFTILKDATATAVYGTRGANGVIIINTRKGKAGKPSITAEVQQGITGFTYLPKFVDAPTFMELFNEGQVLRGKDAFYSEDVIQKHASGVDPDLYPNVDWYDVLFKDNATSNRANVNITGGADIAQYYISLGYYNETGQFKTEDIDTYNSNLKYDRFNFTSNLTVNISPKTKLDFGLNGFLSNYNEPARGKDRIFELATQYSPHITPIQYSNGLWPFVKGTTENPYKAMTQSGINNSYDNVVRSNLKLTQELDFITEGLNVSGLFAFDVALRNKLTRSRNLPSYFAEGRDEQGELIMNQTETGSPDLSYGLNRYSTRRMYMEAALNYSRTFGLHDVSGLLLFNQSDFADAEERVETYQAAIPYRQRNLVGRATYGYDRKYLFESNFSYSGSDNFTPTNRYGLFASVGLGWVVSNEEFFEPIKDIFPHFKLRYSYGSSGNASLDNPDNRFLYLTQYEQEDVSYQFGIPGSERFYSGYQEKLMRGEVTWETSYRHNLGVEFNMFNNDLQFIAELFMEDRKGILMRGLDIPYVSGYNSGNVPFLNIGETTNKGIDLTLEYNKQMVDGFFMARGTMNYNSNNVIRDNLPPWAYPYLDREGHRISQRFGYIATGLFKTQQEIEHAATQAGDVRVGDIRFKDLNGDGIINSNDQTAIGFGDVPQLTYGLTLGGGYKGFDLSLFFQGVGMVDLNYSSGYAVTPFSNGATYGNMYEYVLDRWDPENPDKETLYPRLSTNETVTTNYNTSSWWVKRADYLRLKQAEIGYSFTEKPFLDRLAINRLRLYVNGTNLFTISPWKFWDPEIGDGRGVVYPNTRVFNVGLRINFK